MSHPNRSRRRANANRRKRAAERQKPVAPGEQAFRAAERRAAHLRRYPVPPLYRLSYEYPEPEQPACYRFQSV